MNDRIEQVNEIRSMAADIRFGAAGEGTPEELVKYHLGQIDLPEWFDDHDRGLLLRFVSED